MNAPELALISVVVICAAGVGIAWLRNRAPAKPTIVTVDPSVGSEVADHLKGAVSAFGSELSRVLRAHVQSVENAIDSKLKAPPKAATPMHAPIAPTPVAPPGYAPAAPPPSTPAPAAPAPPASATAPQTGTDQAPVAPQTGSPAPAAPISTVTQVLASIDGEIAALQAKRVRLVEAEKAAADAQKALHDALA